MLGKNAIVILANELSKGLPEDKGTTLLCNKPLIRYVYNSVKSIVDEVLIVTNTDERAEKYAAVLPKTVQFVIDNNVSQNSLSGAISGFEAVQGAYTLLLSYDSPFVNKELALLLFDLAVGKTAVVPRNADNEMEPLCSVYQTKIALETAKKVANEGAVDLQTFVEKLQGVRYISKMIVEQVDPELQSFFSVNSLLDLKRATIMLQGKARVYKK
ncbi:MAG: NTP transferase domain-containing protein [Nitrososphaerota archaeon]|jgi:molybdopterin-guanine dinucleotide biosynthesis protein A|nr:NTP transferase domain-containing protein [Nitrososphaerota archaeon]